MDATAWATFWAFMGLVTFLAILVYLKVPGRILQALDDRSTRIRRELDEARQLRTEARELLASYQRRRQEAEEEARAIIEQARREAEILTTEARQRMVEYVERRTRAVETRIGQAEAQALAEVRARAVDVAAAAAANVLSERTDGEADRRLFDQSLRAIRTHIGRAA